MYNKYRQTFVVSDERAPWWTCHFVHVLLLSLAQTVTIMDQFTRTKYIWWKYLVFSLNCYITQLSLLNRSNIQLFFHTFLKISALFSARCMVNVLCPWTTSQTGLYKCLWPWNSSDKILVVNLQSSKSYVIYDCPAKHWCVTKTKILNQYYFISNQAWELGQYILKLSV